jgi:hypothetical protein
MKTLKIKEPIWISKSIGIAEKRLDANLKITISYKDKYGNKVYPNTYTMLPEKIKTYRTQYIRGNRIYIVPIQDLTVIK